MTINKEWMPTKQTGGSIEHVVLAHDNLTWLVENMVLQQAKNGT